MIVPDADSRRPAHINSLRGQDTLLASWGALAAVSPGARLVGDDDAVAAVFPTWAPLNNAIVRGSTSPGHVERAAAAAGRWFAIAGVPVWSLWLSSGAVSFRAPDEVTDVPGLVRDTTTLVMTRDLSDGLTRDDRVIRTSIASSSTASDQPLASSDLEVPDGVAGLDGWALVHADVAVAGAWTYRHGLDCGVYAVGTAPAHRRQGLAMALVEHVLAEAFEQGCRTASLQSTRMGQQLYERLGFTAVGRYDEWIHVADDQLR